MTTAPQMPIAAGSEASKDVSESNDAHERVLHVWNDGKASAIFGRYDMTQLLKEARTEKLEGRNESI
jgi:hypothetical protein